MVIFLFPFASTMCNWLICKKTFPKMQKKGLPKNINLVGSYQINLAKESYQPNRVNTWIKKNELKSSLTHFQLLQLQHNWGHTNLVPEVVGSPSWKCVTLPGWASIVPWSMVKSEQFCLECLWDSFTKGRNQRVFMFI